MSAIRSQPDERLQAYILANQPPEHDESRDLRRRTQALPNGHMQIQPEQGHLLAFLVGLLDARRVLEIGTFTGYSALAMALALPPDGTLTTCEVDADVVAVGRSCWERAGVADRIDVRIGPALATLARLMDEAAGRFDLAFIDADKMAYDRYYELGLRLVRPGGVIVIDNTFQRGEVADPTNCDPRTVSLRALNAKIARDERVDRVILPLADGMTLARRRPPRVGHSGDPIWPGGSDGMPGEKNGRTPRT
jgi:predicted O-methyltransferase YrrM